MPSICKHCGSDIPADADGEFCCSGCAVAYDIVQGAGLSCYYDRRTLDDGTRSLIPESPVTIDYAPYIIEESEGLQTIHLIVEGIHCAACVWLIETLLSKEEGVQSARLNMTTRRLTVKWKKGATSIERVIGVVHQLGYRLMPYDPAMLEQKDRQQERFLLLCMSVAGFAAMNVMLFSISIWSGADSMQATTKEMMHWFSALIALPAIAFSVQPFLRSAVQALRHWRMNMDVPISLAVILTAILSLYETIIGAPDTYFDSAVMLLFFLLIGRYLDTRTRTKSASAAERLLALQATAASVKRSDGTLETVPVSSLKTGDIIVVACGERIAADGVVVSGRSSLDTSLITGESLPRNIFKGDEVVAGTLNLEAPLNIRTTALGDDTVLANIARLVEQAANGKGKYIRIADRAARIYAPAVHLLAAITFVLWLGLGAGMHQAILYAVAVLIVTCPCALALAVPAVQVASGTRLLKSGIILKSATALERLRKIDTVVFDKTGTMTHGSFSLVVGPDAEDLRLAGGLAATSKHPLAQALYRHCPDVPVFENVKEFAGQGLEASVDGASVRLGNRAFCQVEDGWAAAAPDGMTELWLWKEGSEPQCFLFEDTTRDDARSTVQTFLDNGLEVHLLSGDMPAAVRSIANDVGIEHWHAQITPAGKHDFIEGLVKQGRQVLMVGDGINDAPSLAAAHVGMTIGSAAADISRTAADVIVQSESLDHIVKTWLLSKKAWRAIQMNFAFSISYNIVAVPLAMAGLISPLWAAVFMSASSITVMLNAMRLLRFKF